MKYALKLYDLDGTEKWYVPSDNTTDYQPQVCIGYVFHEDKSKRQLDEDPGSMRGTAKTLQEDGFDVRVVRIKYEDKFDAGVKHAQAAIAAEFDVRGGGGTAEIVRGMGL